MTANLNGLSPAARAVIAASLWLPARDRDRIICSGSTWNELTEAFPQEIAVEALLPPHLENVEAVGPREQGEFQKAHARSSDPSTSHEAARSLTPETLRASQIAVLCCLALGWATDEDLVARYEKGREVMLWPKQSPSGIRSRRAELVRADPPMAEDSGERQKLASGRKGIVWRVANTGSIPAVSRNREENQ